MNVKYIFNDDLAHKNVIKGSEARNEKRLRTTYSHLALFPNLLLTSEEPGSFLP